MASRANLDSASAHSSCGAFPISVCAPSEVSSGSVRTYVSDSTFWGPTSPSEGERAHLPRLRLAHLGLADACSSGIFEGLGIDHIVRLGAHRAAPRAFAQKHTMRI